MNTQIKLTQQIGNIVKTIVIFDEKIRDDLLNGDIKNNIKNLFKTKYLKKAYKTFYILDMDLTIFDYELPMIDNNQNFSIKINCDLFMVTINDVINCKLNIDNNILQAYNDKILCDIIQNNEYNINISEKNVIYNDKTYYNNEDVNIIIKKIKNLSSTGDRILVEGDIYNGTQY